ncbi:branched-chain amino acid ABC transporter permease [Natronomonas gomsonensis]|uniref:branched-chain amino acid ABC transporter permease n=1 Tax=Natronomonas gomsonensis TaxID=1046043 RepID=UPI0015BCF987|nr:branched-chain amino acid ABC transporter permease [Natronomonas gomsonensis]
MSVSSRLEPLFDAIGQRDIYIILATVAGIYLVFSVILLGRTPSSAIGALETVTFFMLVYAITALALNLHWGYAGLFNIGVAGFMAVGVYTMTMLTRAPDADPAGFGLPLWVGVIVGMAASAVVGLLAALPALRLKADYLAIVTLGLSEIIRYVTLSSAVDDWLQSNTARFVTGETGVGTNGGSGLSIEVAPSVLVDYLYYTGGDSSAGTTFLGDIVFGFGDTVGLRDPLLVDITYLGVLVVALALFYALLFRIGNSPFGRVLKAIREDELVAKSLGKDTNLFKVKVFMVGCALMGLAGMLWHGSQSFVSPTSFRPVLTFYVFIAVIIGGSGSNTGSVVGGFLFASLLFEAPRRIGGTISNANLVQSTPNSFAEAVAGPLEFLAYTADNIGAIQFIILGVVLVAIIRYRPDGVLGHRTESAAAVDLSNRGENDE